MGKVKVENNSYFEEKYNQENNTKDIRTEIMSEEEIKRCDFYVNKYIVLLAEKQILEEEWIEIQNAYSSDRSEDSSNNETAFVNAIVPNIEGQLASMTERTVKATIKGKGISDEAFASTLEPLADAIFRENKIRRKMKQFGRRYLLFGNAYMIPEWDKDMLDEGMPRITTPQLADVLIDGKVKNIDDINYGDFCIQIVGDKSIIWARKKFGDEIADSLQLGNELAMGASGTSDDKDSFVYLKVWTRNNKEENLQLIEMSTSGILLQESNSAEPYYTCVNNKYPIFGLDLYPIENDIHGFGDGKLLLPIQKLINRLYDEIIIAIKFSSQGRTYADPNARLDPNEFAENDPSKPLVVSNPSQLIKTERGIGINSVVFSVLDQLFAKIQEATRFSALMTGQNSEGSMTATQSNIQMQQGNTGVTDKQTDISRMLSDVLEYSLGMCLQFWTAEKAFRIANVDDETKREYAWINPNNLKNVPIKVPSTEQYRKDFIVGNPEGKVPRTMILTDSNGKDMVKNIELDVLVSIGEGMPNNKMAMYQMVLSLSQLQVLDSSTGQPRSLFTYSQVKDMMEDILGINIKEDEKGGTIASAQNMPNVNLNQNANVAGNGTNGMAK